jgi:acetyltransferase (GNAT) family protein
MSLNSLTVNRTAMSSPETSSKELRTLANPNPRHETPRACLLQQLQELSVTMLRATTTAMAVRSPRTALSLEELAGGCLAFCGPDVPLTRAIGVGTAGSVREAEVARVESFYRARNSAVRIVISERTDPWLPAILKKRGYQAADYMQNWWLPLERKALVQVSGDIEIVPAGLKEADLWVRTVAAGFQEKDSPVDEGRIQRRTLDTFYCLGFADGAQRFFAKYKGVIAGGGALHVSGETASIRTASCRIEHRNKGVQRALLAFRLEAAIKAGCRFAFSSTDKLGASSRNLRRFGFTPLSNSFTMSSVH